MVRAFYDHLQAVELTIIRHLEIDPEVDFDSRRAVYFRQMRYGLFVRLLHFH
jgi:aspartate carbamoyltransferase catalytic subunit